MRISECHSSEIQSLDTCELEDERVEGRIGVQTNVHIISSSGDLGLSGAGVGRNRQVCSSVAYCNRRGKDSAG
jgi:hypothetical protein